MSMNANRSRLTAITKELATKWDQTKDHWHDAKSLEFERNYIEDLLASVDIASAVIDQLDKLTAKARNDCE